MSPLVLPACAKVNLDLRILGVRPDGFHDLKTIFQTLALHDDVTFRRTRGALTIVCDDASVPTDHRNLVWRAAAVLWRSARGRSDVEPSGVAIELRKRIPHAAGLGGGSADAAMALLGLARLWKLDIDMPTLSRLAAAIGADVPFFLVGGTALGLGRGDDIYPLVDLPRTYVVIVRPDFGVSTADAYGWYDGERRTSREGRRPPLPARWPEWAASLHNDLEAPVTRRHPTIGRIKRAMLDSGAASAAMSGSGSAVFGLFERLDAARRAASSVSRPGWTVVVTRTLSRAEYAAWLRRARPSRRARPARRGRRLPGAGALV